MMVWFQCNLCRSRVLRFVVGHQDDGSTIRCFSCTDKFLQCQVLSNGWPLEVLKHYYAN